MFNTLNRFLVLITVGALAATVGLGWWLNITIDQKALLKQAVASQEYVIATLHEDAADREWVISENKTIQEDIINHMINKYKEIEVLKRENPNKCYTQPIPDNILERLYENSGEDSVHQPSDEPPTAE